MALSELEKIAKVLKKGHKVDDITPRILLEWFDAQRRGPNIVAYIREQLEEAGIHTVPDFESEWIDSDINFELNKSRESKLDAAELQVEGSGQLEVIAFAEQISGYISRDATYKISRLKAANQAIVSIAPDEKLARAITLMMENGFSQLPVMSGDFSVKGVISWKTIGRGLSLGKSIGAVRDFMEPHHEIRSSLSIFEAISVIVVNDYVLVRGENNRITGIITAADLSLQFHTLTEPFLLLSEIENLVRNIIGSNFTSAELAAVRDPSASSRDVKTVFDLTFGEYIRLIECEDRWSRLNIGVDRKIFCERLGRIRSIRNDVMHFDPDGVSDDDLENLRKFAGLLKQLENY